MNILSSNSKPNRDIRLAVADEGFYLWQLAAELGITDGTLSKKLRRELDRSLIEFDHQIFSIHSSSESISSIISDVQKRQHLSINQVSIPL